MVARLPYVPKLGSDDFLYDTLDVAIWSTVEQGLAITAGSLATLRPLIKLVGYKLGLTTSPTGRARTNSNYKLDSGLNRTPQKPVKEERSRRLNSRSAGGGDDLDLDLESFAAYGTSAQATHDKGHSYKGSKNEIVVASQILIDRSDAAGACRSPALLDKKLPSLPAWQRSDNAKMRSESAEALRTEFSEGRDSDEQRKY